VDEPIVRRPTGDHSDWDESLIVHEGFSDPTLASRGRAPSGALATAGVPDEAVDGHGREEKETASVRSDMIAQ